MRKVNPKIDPTTIGIIVPVLNYFQGFVDLMLSVKTKYQYRVYVQPQYIGQVPLAAVWNKGCRDAFADGCHYALVCNDDILFSPDCIDKMVEEYDRLRHSDNVIMVTPNNIMAQVGDKYQILNYEIPEGTETSWSEHPNFSCFLITPEYFDVVGSFDEKFTPAWYEDNDSHRRATLAGFKEICSTACASVHIGAVTTKMMANPDSGTSQAHYIEKWGGLPATHMRADLPVESYLTPYNDPTKTIKDW